jgi:hypothetical protein
MSDRRDPEHPDGVEVLMTRAALVETEHTRTRAGVRLTTPQTKENVQVEATVTGAQTTGLPIGSSAKETAQMRNQVVDTEIEVEVIPLPQRRPILCPLL